MSTKEEVQNNREKFIDWVIANHLEIVKEYLGFEEENKNK